MLESLVLAASSLPLSKYDRINSAVPVCVARLGAKCDYVQSQLQRIDLMYVINGRRHPQPNHLQLVCQMAIIIHALESHEPTPVGALEVLARDYYNTVCWLLFLRPGSRFSDREQLYHRLPQELMHAWWQVANGSVPQPKRRFTDTD